MRILALDIGTRRTGVAFLDEANGIPLPLDTLQHQSKEEFVSLVGDVLRARKIDRLVVGLPLLPSGDEGSQVEVVRNYAESLEKFSVPIFFVDERYTTPTKKRSAKQKIPSSGDNDASAACALLTDLKID